MTVAREFLSQIALGVFRPAPEDPVWEWADQHVVFNAKQAAELPAYDSAETPWTREWQDFARSDDFTEAFFLKSSQTGVSEGALNVLRWAPANSPGNALYVINSREKAKRVSRERLLPSLVDLAEAQMTDNPDDVSTHHISLSNMEITVTGAGSPAPFRETWYRYVFLDEVEDHELLPDGSSTYAAALGRFSTVSDAKLWVFGKPQFVGGVCHQGFLKGTQERWMMPCPRCGEEINFEWDFLKFGHCRDLAEGWDLHRVVAETYYECQRCHGAIHEREKRDMVRAGRWVPAPAAARQRLEGRAVPSEPGVRSFHISDLYTLFPKWTWGQLAKKWVLAYLLKPNKAEQDAFRTEHLGLPIEPDEFAIRDDTIDNLRAGLIEEKDGKNIVRIPRGWSESDARDFQLAYSGGQFHAPLPFDPFEVTVCFDAQADVLKYVTFAWSRWGEAFAIDFGSVDWDVEAVRAVFAREYQTLSGRLYEPVGGLIDARYRMQTVYKFCLALQASGKHLLPSKGTGPSSEYQGKSIREVEDWTEDGRKISAIHYYDHSATSDLYLGKIQRREEPRLWLPNPVPAALKLELSTTKLQTKRISGRTVQFWHHDATIGPNDYGDTCKMQYLYRRIRDGAMMRRTRMKRTGKKA